MALAFGEFGSSQATLTDSGFFRWFNLEPTNEGRGGEICYRPSGEAFHALVSFRSQATSSGDLLGLHLFVARSFIDDPRQSPFARDIIRSFLQAIAGPAAPELAPLMHEIQFRGLATTVLMRGAPPNLPPSPSTGYRTIMGEERSWSREIAGNRLTMVNESDDERRLALHVAAPAAEGGSA